jgi:ATP-dependent RNA helicase SUPV3L1/SUV3
VRLGAFSLYLPALLKPEAAVASAGVRPIAGAGPEAGPRARALPSPAPSASALAAYGLRALGGLAVPVDQLERLDDAPRRPRQGEGVVLSDQAREDLGWDAAMAGQILRALGFAPVRKGEAQVWRRRAPPRHEDRPAQPHSPFAASRRSRPSRLRRGAAGRAAASRPPGVSEAADSCRADVWLWRARFFKTRASPPRFCEEGRVRLTRGGARRGWTSRPGRFGSATSWCSPWAGGSPPCGLRRSAIEGAHRRRPGPLLALGIFLIDRPRTCCIDKPPPRREKPARLHAYRRSLSFR